MILVTGGPGFIGQRLIGRLVQEGRQVRTLIRPSQHSPQLPHGVSVQAAISSLADVRGLRAALVGVDTVYHLAGIDWADPGDDLRTTDIDGTRNLLQAAQDAGVERLVYLSHLDADRAAAYPALKTKGIAEEFVRQSPIPSTILRSAIVYGPGDHFTVRLAQLLATVPRVFPLPGDGGALLQPIWVEDLVTCLAWCLEDDDTLGQTIQVGGPEHISYRRILELVMEHSQQPRHLLPVRPSYLRLLNVLLHTLAPRLPVSSYWLDYLAADRICELDIVPRLFHLMPARFSQRLEYLHGVDWKANLRASTSG
ncbi:MAG: NAD-dependent epimerase/dehydratase family protein [Anaerolineales bacterium]|nr:NAD-dependent epimerase/dehydratase family protein [Anaerolineales bacterium]